MRVSFTWGRGHLYFHCNTERSTVASAPGRTALLPGVSRGTVTLQGVELRDSRFARGLPSAAVSGRQACQHRTAGPYNPH